MDVPNAIAVTGANKVAPPLCQQRRYATQDVTRTTGTGAFIGLYAVLHRTSVGNYSAARGWTWLDAACTNHVWVVQPGELLMKRVITAAGALLLASMTACSSTSSDDNSSSSSSGNMATSGTSGSASGASSSSGASSASSSASSSSSGAASAASSSSGSSQSAASSGAASSAGSSASANSSSSSTMTSSSSSGSSSSSSSSGSSSGSSSSGGPGVLTAEAGPNRYLVNGGILDASTSFVPGGGMATYTWSDLGGSGVVFSNNGASTAQATTMTYTFTGDQVVQPVNLRLMVDTGTEQDMDDVTITLYRADTLFVDQGGAGSGENPGAPAGGIVTALNNRIGQTLIAVARGEYSVNSDPNGDGDVADAEWIVMVDGVVIRGGYAPGTFADRNTAAGPTRVSDVQDTGGVAARGRVVLAPSEVTSSAALESITLAPGGGSRCEGARLLGSPTFYDVTVEPARSTYSVGIVVQNGSPLLNRVTVLGNQVGLDISGSAGRPVVTNSVFMGTTPGLPAVHVQSTGTAPVVLTNNTFVTGGANVVGVRLIAGNAQGAPTGVELRNNVWVAANAASYFARCIGEDFGGANTPVIQNNAFSGCNGTIVVDSQGGCTGGSGFSCLTIAEVNGLPGASGNVFADPMMADPSMGDFHLTASTPATIRNGGLSGTGQPWSSGPEDRDGNARTAPWSMGAFERD